MQPIIYACETPLPSLEQSLTNFSKTLLGKPYKAGGNTRSGFDTSGFIQYVFLNSEANIPLPRTVEKQYEGKQWESVTKSNLLPADLVFFKINGKIQSVGIFIGDNTFITVTIKKGVAIQSLNTQYWKQRYVGAKRIIQPSATKAAKIQSVYSQAKEGRVEDIQGLLGSKPETVIKKLGQPHSEYSNDTYMYYEGRELGLRLENQRINCIEKYETEFNEMEIRKALSGMTPGKKPYPGYSDLDYEVGDYLLIFNYYGDGHYYLSKLP